MRVLDPGHRYELATLDPPGSTELIFVKREGGGYPGNVGAYGGTVLQEVFRACLDRLYYVWNQIPCDETGAAIANLQQALRWMEIRNARLKGLVLPRGDLSAAPTCPTCLHVVCPGHA